MKLKHDLTLQNQNQKNLLQKNNQNNHFENIIIKRIHVV